MSLKHWLLELFLESSIFQRWDLNLVTKETSFPVCFLRDECLNKIENSLHSYKRNLIWKKGTSYGEKKTDKKKGEGAGGF